MNLIDSFLLLSNSRYTGERTCDFMHRYDIGSLRVKMATLDLKSQLTVEKIKEEMKNHNIKLLENILPMIEMAPKFLYSMGDGVVTSKRVAIVGARKCSAYGKSVAYDIAFKLAKCDVTIISGLAYGVDLEAHRGAMDAGGGTVAVLGSGILNCYPKIHQPIYDRILKKGMIISEYGLYSKPLKEHFPFRNRLISGLSDCIIVVEARERSGTMITVRYGLDQGKEIYVVPGSVYSELSQGTHKLIQSGARIITSIEDFIKEFNKTL